MIYDLNAKLQEFAPQFLLPTITLKITDGTDATDTFVTVNVGDEYAGYFSLTEFPGNSEIAISHTVYLGEKFRGKGLGRALNKLRIAACRAAGVKTLLATVNKENTVEKEILRKNGWLMRSITPTAYEAYLEL